MKIGPCILTEWPPDSSPGRSKLSDVLTDISRDKITFELFFCKKKYLLRLVFTSDGVGVGVGVGVIRELMT